MIKESCEQGEVLGVKYINCIRKIFSVQLNVYTFFYDGVLIDTGSRSLEKHFQPFFDTLPIEQAVITHYHEDHTGGGAYLRKKGIPVYMPDLYRKETERRAAYPLYRKIFWGSRKPFTSSPLPETFKSAHAVWRVIETPGHAADHVSFLNETDRILFTGDLYVSPKTKIILREENIYDIIRSLERVLRYEFEHVFCQHAGYVKNGKQALERKLEYLRGLEEKIKIMKRDGLTEQEMVKKLFPRQYPISKLSGHEWDSAHIVHSVLHDS